MDNVVKVGHNLSVVYEHEVGGHDWSGSDSIKSNKAFHGCNGVQVRCSRRISSRLGSLKYSRANTKCVMVYSVHFLRTYLDEQQYTWHSQYYTGLQIDNFFGEKQHLLPKQ